jgi:site-specific recombinase XerD
MTAQASGIIHSEKSKENRTHCLRHSRVMHTIRTAGIENVRQLCGHASIASTGYYVKVSDSSAWAALGAGAGL